jgi:hypothetical protein
MAIELVSRYRVDKTTISLISLNKFHIGHTNLLDMLDIATDVHSITKVKEYRFHVPIYHIFWELQVAELPEYIATRMME